MEKTSRRKYLVRKPVQYRFMRFVGLPLLIVSAAVYYIIYYAVFSEMLIPEAVASTLLPAMRKVNVILLIAGPLVLYGILRTALIYSNRIFGPLPRIEKDLDRAIAGDYSVRLKTRGKDELGGFVDKINMLLDAVDRGRKEKS